MAEDTIKTGKFYNMTLGIKLGLTTHSPDSKTEVCSEETRISYGHNHFYLFHSHLYLF